MIMASNSKGHSASDFGRLYIFGAGGAGREIAWLAEQTWGDEIERVFVVDRPEYISAPVNGVPVTLLADIKPDRGDRFIVALGDVGPRRIAVSALVQAGLEAATLVHPRAELSSSANVGKGSVIYPGVVVTTNVDIGEHTQVNVGSTLSHDVRVGSYVSISPGVHIAGHVHVGCDVFVGIGATFINGRADAPLIIGRGAVIAAGACVVKSVEQDALVAGVPALRKR